MAKELWLDNPGGGSMARYRRNADGAGRPDEYGPYLPLETLMRPEGDPKPFSGWSPFRIRRGKLKGRYLGTTTAAKRRRRKRMARRTLRGRKFTFRSKSGRFVKRARAAAARRTRRVKRHPFRVAGVRTLRGRVSVRRRTFTLKRKSKFKKRLRGYRINPVLASYLNPRRGRRRSMARRRYRSNPPFSAVLEHPTAFVMPGLVGAASAIGVVTVGNMIRNQFLSSFTFGGATGNILITAAVRAGVAYAADEFVMKGTEYREAFRIGATIGIVGSAILDFMNKSFTLGEGDSAQTPQTLLGLSGAGGYTRALAGAGSYSRLNGTGRAGVGAPRMAQSATDRIYGQGM